MDVDGRLLSSLAVIDLSSDHENRIMHQPVDRAAEPAGEDTPSLYHHLPFRSIPPVICTTNIT